MLTSSSVDSLNPDTAPISLLEFAAHVSMLKRFLHLKPGHLYAVSSSATKAASKLKNLFPIYRHDIKVNEDVSQIL